MSTSSLKDVAGKDSENASNSSSSNGEGGGNNSDNSALVSLGNTSFGFNFESDGGFNNLSGSNCGSNSPSEEGDSDQGDRKPKEGNSKDSDKVHSRDRILANPQTSSTLTSGDSAITETERSSESDESKKKAAPQKHQTPKGQPKLPSVKPEAAVEVSSLRTTSSVPMSAGAAAAKISSDAMKPPPVAARPITAQNDNTADIVTSCSHNDAASAAVANLNQIATDASTKKDAENEAIEKRGLKRKSDDDSGGYNSDDEWGKSDDITLASATAGKDQDVKQEMAEDTPDRDGKMSKCGSSEGGTNKKKKLDDSKREERNAREKERSFRISKQINELRSLLSSGGVIVPKGTKSSVLTEAANYIRMLQQHHYRSEIDRHQLVQQVQRIGSGALGQQAAQAVRHAAAQNGVWSLGNFGGVPPKSAMMYHQPSGAGAPVADETQSSASNNGTLPNTIEESDYIHVFNSCTIGMAIASMGGAFIDCNNVFCQIANYTKQEICSMTVFNLTARSDLQPAFDLISQMLSAPLDPNVTNTSCVLRGALKHRTDVGLSVKLIKGNDGVAKCFCVTLINNPASPYDVSKPIPATLGHPGAGQMHPGTKENQHGLDVTPAFTTG